MNSETKINLLIEALKVLREAGDQKDRDKVRELLVKELKMVTY